MSKLILLFAVLFSFNALAQSSVTVLIDGKTYSCTEGGVSLNTCSERLAAMTAKHTVCRDIYSEPDCFNSIFKGAIDKKCPDMVQVCNNLCKKIYSVSACYNICF